MNEWIAHEFFGCLNKYAWWPFGSTVSTNHRFQSGWEFCFFIVCAVTKSRNYIGHYWAPIIVKRLQNRPSCFLTNTTRLFLTRYCLDAESLLSLIHRSSACFVQFGWVIYSLHCINRSYFFTMRCELLDRSIGRLLLNRTRVESVASAWGVSYYTDCKFYVYNSLNVDAIPIDTYFE